MSATKAAVTAIASGPGALWVTTRSGHLLAFNPLTADVLLVHQRNCNFSAIVCLTGGKLVTFGEGVMGEGPEDVDLVQETTGMFTVWENYIE